MAKSHEKLIDNIAVFYIKFVELAVIHRCAICYLLQMAAVTAQTRPSQYALGVGLGSSQWERSVDLRQLTVMVIKQSLGSWSHLWSLNNVSGCGSTSLFGSRAGTRQIRGQSRALEDRNDSNNSHLTPLFTSFTTVRIWI